MNGRIMTISLSEYLKKRLFLFTFLFGLVAGTFVINTMSSEYYQRINVTQDHYMEMISDVVVDRGDILKNGIAEYYKEFVIILVLNCFFFGKVYNALYLFVKGAGMGVVISSYVMKYGVKGLLIYIISIFPQYILYVPAVILTICAGISMRHVIVEKSSRNTLLDIKDISAINIIRLLRKFTVYMIILFGFALFISLVEAYVNIPLFRGYIENT